MYRVIKCSGLFDREYYLRNNLDVARSCVNPIKHYIHYGWREGRNPGPLFDTNWYLQQNPDVAKAGINPLYHYIKHGVNENRKPSPFFSNGDYLASRKRGSHLAQKVPTIPFELFSSAKISLKDRYKNKKVSIVLPVYNAYECLEKLLESIFKNSDINFDLTAIDDMSTDNRIRPLLQKYSHNHKNFKFLQNPRNLGFVKTVNRGIKLITETDVLIINSDVEVPQNWLSRIFHPMWSRAKVASVTPMSNSATIMSFPEVGHHDSLFEGMSLQEIDDEFQRLNPDNDIYIESPTGHGFCMAMSRQAIDQIGLFDERAFGKGYGEENDWCMRAKQIGFKNLIATNIFLLHHHAESFDSETRANNMRNNSRILHRRYPKYLSEVQNTKENFNYRTIRDFLLLLLLAKHSTKTVLRFENSLGGGSAFACTDYVENNKADTLILLVRPSAANSKYMLDIWYRNYRRNFALKSEDDICQLFNHIKIDKININQLIGYDSIKEILSSIAKIKRTHAPVIEMNIRDFYTVCPQYNLMYMEKEFCNAAASEYDCSRCYSKIVISKSFKLNFPTLSCWRKMWYDFFPSVNSIVIFSNFTKSVFLKCYPEMKGKIVKSDMPINYLRKVIIPQHKNRVNIAIIGNINYFKGSVVALDLVRLAKAEFEEEVKVFLFGRTNDYNLRQKIIYKGVFERESLPDLMEQNQIDIVFIPTICGETFCRTAEEAIKMEMPVATFNIGAPPERVSKYEKGLVIDKLDAGYALDRILEFVKTLRNVYTKAHLQENSFQ